MIDIVIIESHRIKLFTHVCGLNNWRSEQVHFKCFIWVVLESGGGGGGWDLSDFSRASCVRSTPLYPPPLPGVDIQILQVSQKW